jgi:hypothetical protein
LEISTVFKLDFLDDLKRFAKPCHLHTKTLVEISLLQNAQKIIQTFKFPIKIEMDIHYQFPEKSLEI